MPGTDRIAASKSMRAAKQIRLSSRASILFPHSSTACDSTMRSTTTHDGTTVHQPDASRVAVAAWLAGSAIFVVMLPLAPPDDRLGAIGWGVALAACAGSLLLASLQRHRPQAVTVGGSSVLGYYSLGELAILQWLAGGTAAPYDLVAVLFVVAVAATHRASRTAIFAAAIAATLALPLLYEGWSAMAAARLVALLLICGALAVVTHAAERPLGRKGARLVEPGEQGDEEPDAGGDVEQRRAQYIAFAAHDLRTPLTAIKGYLDAFLDGDVGELTEEQREYAIVVQRNALRLQALTEDLLTACGQRPRHLCLEHDLVDLGDVLREVCAALSLLARERDLQVVIDADTSVFVVGDRVLLYQVIDNLVENAVKFSPRGGQLCLRARGDGARATAEVVDHGVGIPPDEVAQVTEQFFRASNALAVEGTGVGLAIVMQLIECHGGYLEIDSELGAGSTFRVVLPACHLPSGQREQQPLVPPAAGVPIPSR